ncbi:MAG: DsrE family protein [Luminiphilus sp.]|nr:DsrE family protein [Luminiphilus sp.]MDG1654191.1 DsrE family protein [Luminiphilus sp.]
MASPAHWLFIITSPPYEHGLASDPAIDAVMAAGAFGQSVSLVFLEDGLSYLTMRTQIPKGQTDLSKLLRSLPLYDVNDVFYVEPTAQSLPLDSVLGGQPISDRAVADLMTTATHVVTF